MHPFEALEVLFSLFFVYYLMGFYSSMTDDEKDECRLSEKGIKDRSLAQLIFFHVKVCIKIQ